MIYGYARVSTAAQDETGQVRQLKAAGCEKVFREKITGTTADRPQLAKLMKRLAPGDVVITPAVDRLSRDTTDLLVIAREMQRAGAGIRSLAEPFLDTTSDFAEIIFAILGVAAKLEHRRILDRMTRGRADAKANGVTFGRKPILTPHQQQEARKRLEAGEQLCSLGLGSPIVRAASRLARRATARCAAAALTRPARWALGPSDGQHGVPASVSVGPAVTIAEHRIKGGEHFAHDRDDRDFRLLARGNEAMVEGAQCRVEPERGQGWHVERVADGYATSIDVALPTEPAAIERVWRQADQCGDLLAADLAEFGQQGQQGIGERGADAGHRAQQAEALDEVWLGCNQLGQTLVEQNDVGLYPGEAPLSDALSAGRLRDG